MNRRQKYPNTKTFRFFNANPKDRFTGDCVIRAISTATEMDYNTVVMGLAETMCETGYDMQSPEGFDRYLAKIGWVKQKQPRKANGTKYTGEEFCKYLNNALDYRRIKKYIRCLKSAIYGTFLDTGLSVNSSKMVSKMLPFGESVANLLPLKKGEAFQLPTKQEENWKPNCRLQFTFPFQSFILVMDVCVSV